MQPVGQPKMIDNKNLYFKITSENQRLNFYYSQSEPNRESDWEIIAENISGNTLNSRVFTGAFAGIYGVAANHKTNNFFIVDYFVMNTK